jgi:hypothetical protein
MSSLKTKVGDIVEVQLGNRIHKVKVTSFFPGAEEIIGKLLTASGQDPRGDFLVAGWEGNRFVFKHSLTPEQAGERPLTAEERAVIEATKPKQPAAQHADPA